MLETVAEAQRPLGMVELARLSDLDVNVVYRLMHALEGRGMVTREAGSRRYVIGPKLLSLSAKVIRKLNIRDLALPLMQELVAETSETVSLHARSGAARICIAAIEGTHAIRRVLEEGQLLPLYVGPSGKSILAYIDPPELDALVAEAVEAGRDEGGLRAQLRSIRARGYLASAGDRLPGVSSISVPIFGPTGVVASLTVSGPSDRWTEAAMEKAAPKVCDRGQQLSTFLDARPAKSDGMRSRPASREHQ